jgi:regulator of replication initiation timing
MTSLVPILTLILGVAVKAAIIIAIIYFVVKKTSLIATKEDMNEIKSNQEQLIKDNEVLKQEIQELRKTIDNIDKDN